MAKQIKQPKIQPRDVEVVNICTLMDQLFGKDRYSPATLATRLSYKEESAIVMAWVKDNNAHYYADPREDFFTWKGQEEAAAAGKKIVVVEDLS